MRKTGGRLLLPPARKLKESRARAPDKETESVISGGSERERERERERQIAEKEVRTGEGERDLMEVWNGEREGEADRPARKSGLEKERVRQIARQGSRDWGGRG